MVTNVANPRIRPADGNYYYYSAELPDGQVVYIAALSKDEKSPYLTELAALIASLSPKISMHWGPKIDFLPLGRAVAMPCEGGPRSVLREFIATYLVTIDEYFEKKKFVKKPALDQVIERCQSTDQKIAGLLKRVTEASARYISPIQDSPTNAVSGSDSKSVNPPLKLRSVPAGATKGSSTRTQ